MERIYRKNPLTLALVWIGAYVVLMSLADGLSDAVGVSKSVTVIVSAVLTAMLLGWVRTGKRAAYFGLAKPDAPAAGMLYYLPLAVMISVNLWHGITLNTSPVETVLYMVSMLFVGVLEEVIFRHKVTEGTTYAGAAAVCPVCGSSELLEYNNHLDMTRCGCGWKARPAWWAPMWWLPPAACAPPISRPWVRRAPSG